MPKKNEKSSEKIMGKTPKEATMEISDLFPKGENPSLEILDVFYSNISFIQASPRDVVIDFLQAPGVPEDDEFKVPAVRIYLNYPAAKRLSETLQSLIDKGKKEERIEGI